MKILARAIIKLFARIFPYSVYKYFIRKYDSIYSHWIKCFIPNAASTALISHGCKMCGGENIYIGERTLIQKHSILTAIQKYKDQNFDSKIIIGNNVNLGEYNNITSTNKITIEDGVLTGRWVTISDNNHGDFTNTDLQIMPEIRSIVSKGDVFIGRNVWIGDKATILSGVHIGEGVIVAANAVVTKDIPPYCLVAGIPAKILKRIDN